MARLSAFVLGLVAVLSFPVLAATELGIVNAPAALLAADVPRLSPNPLLAVDQNRTTVVDRIVREWGASLASSNAGINNTQLREMLMGLRADHLLAASLAGNLDGLRNVLANAVGSTAQVSPRLSQAKAGGSLGEDLVYTPVVPCRIVDSRLAGGALGPGATRNWLAANPTSNFVAQGGSSSDCGIPVKPAAVQVNITVANTAGGMAYLLAWPYNQVQPNASTLNWTAANSIIANAVIVPLCTGACAYDFSVFVTSPTDVIVDVLGYFTTAEFVTNTPVNRGTYYTGVNNVIGGSASNAVASYAVGVTIAGGGCTGGSSCIGGAGPAGNLVAGDFGTVGGGLGNIVAINSSYSTVGGGYFNAAQSVASTTAGGSNNLAFGQGATVGGGGNNRAEGPYATVPGGVSNSAIGFGSFAAGTGAKTYAMYPAYSHDGAFVWADYNPSSLEFHSTSGNEFAARATGGVRFVTAIDFTGAPTWTCGVSGGSGGSWGCSSDRDLKAGLVPMDGIEVLDRLLALPIYRWFAKQDVRKTPHAGPTAQDFMSTFGLGDNDKMIGFADAQGVAFAAIQGLHTLVQQKDAELRMQEREITVLKRKLEAIEAKLGLN